jgi:hypothetical protein
MTMMSKRFTLLLILTFASVLVRAQFKNLKLDDPKTALQACEPTVAINKKDPKNIVVSASTDNIYFTKDGGLNWRKTKISSAYGVHDHPVLVTDDKDNFFCLHLSTVGGVERIVSHESKDGGETWSEGQLVDDENLTKDNRCLRLTTDNKGSLLATWTQSDQYGSADPKCESIILYSKSSNGKKWSKPVRISQNAGNCVEGNTMATGSSVGISTDGKVYAIWANQGKIFFDRSFNGGDMWLSTDLPVADQPGGSSFKIPGHDHGNGFPQLLMDNSKGMMRGSVYIAWSDQRNGPGNTDVWFTRSHNLGDNWTQAMRINNDETETHQYFPHMTVDQITGYIYIVYYDRRESKDLSTDVYLAYSIDGGASFKNVKISETSFTPQDDKHFGDYISVSAHKGVITPVWTRMDEGFTSVWTTIIREEQLDINKPAKK